MERIWLKSYPEGVPAEIDLSALGSLGDFIKTSFDKFRDRTAFISMGKAMSYGELDLKSRAFASYLQNVARLPRGARVALMMPNVLQYPIAAFGALRAGYVVVNCNPLYSPRELKHQLVDLGAQAIVVLENFASTLEKAIDGSALKAIIVTGAGDQLGGARGSSSIRSCGTSGARSRLSSAAGGAFQSCAGLGGAELVQGDADRAGRCRLSSIHRRDHRRAQGGDADPSEHGGQSAQIHAWVASAVRAEGEIFVAALPLYHVFALQVNGFVPLMIGASNFMIANPRDIPALVNSVTSNAVYRHPRRHALFDALLNDKDFIGLDFSHLHLTIDGGMAVQRAVAERWQS